MFMSAQLEDRLSVHKNKKFRREEYLKESIKMLILVSQRVYLFGTCARQTLSILSNMVLMSLSDIKRK